jgi:TRAP-type uncharacterized transport system substrate-binding protein
MKYWLLAIITALSMSVQSQTLKVATGSAKGTYAAMFKELTQVCGTEVVMIEVPSTGSMDNINQLVGNQVNAAFVQSDVLYLRAQTEELGNVKTLLSLHNEAVHIVAMAHSGVKEGGTMGIGAKEVVFDDLSSLANRRVGASGGSFVTAQVIRLQSQVPFNVTQYETNDLALKALLERQLDAVIMVGGAPLGSVAALSTAYKLLPIPTAMAERLKGVYRTARLNYPKMGAAGVPTVATDALFVTREYKTAKMTDALAKFRACALTKVEELKETTGTHPAWQAVDVANKGKWPWYDLPVTTAKK